MPRSRSFTRLSQPALRVREGTSARFTCGADGNPVPRYTWYRVSDGNSDSLQSNIVMGEGRELVLVGSRHTTGQYQCEARVGEHVVRSHVAKLSLYTRPVIITQKVKLDLETSLSSLNFGTSKIQNKQCPINCAF